MADMDVSVIAGPSMTINIIRDDVVVAVVAAPAVQVVRVITEGPQGPKGDPGDDAASFGDVDLGTFN